MSEREKIVLAYSGGLDTSVALRWMMEQYDADVIALLVDVGQPFEAEQVRRRAADAGAAEAIVIDARAEFAEHYCLPTLQAGALYENRYSLASALSRPLIAQKQVEVARRVRRDRRRARLHRQGQRPGPLRGRGRRARPRSEGATRRCATGT